MGSTRPPTRKVLLPLQSPPSLWKQITYTSLMSAGAENPSGMWRRQDTSWLLPFFFLGAGEGKGM